MTAKVPPATCSTNTAIIGGKNSPIASDATTCAWTSCPRATSWTTHRDEEGNLHRQVEFDNTAFFLSAWLRCLVFNLMSRFAQAMGGEYVKMWAGTLLRKFIRRPATLYLIGKELHVVFDPFPGQDDLQPLLDELNAKRTALPWLNNLVMQFSIAQEEPIYPLTQPEKRNRLFGDG